MEWITDLDMLADAGVLNFDAASYIRGTKPRYAYRPQVRYLPGDFEYFYTPLKEDSFNINDKKLNEDNNTPAWKKILFATLVTTGVLFLGYKLRNTKFAKNLTEKIKKTPEKLKDLWTKLVNKIKKPATPESVVTTPAP